MGFPQRSGRSADAEWRSDRRHRRRPARPGPFPEKQIALLQTFADQAVIAMENVRLFKELEARTTELTQSVGELQALGEVGQAVSSTLDLETVLSTIVARATQLAGMDGGSCYEYEEVREEFRLHTAHRLPDELIEALRSRPVPKGEGAVGQLAVTVSRSRYGRSWTRASTRARSARSFSAMVIGPARSAAAAQDRLLGGLVVNRRAR